MSIVVPAYNEEDVLKEFHQAVNQALSERYVDLEIIYINDDITSFTIAPLKISTYIGITTALTAFAYGIYMVIDTLLHGNEVPGYPSLIVIILILGGIQLVAIGILGEYIGRIFNETKQRPLYFINQYLPGIHATSKNIDDSNQ